MARYDLEYEEFVARAMARGRVDFQTFILRGIRNGIDPERLILQLLDDLENDGPIFGQFFRSLEGASSSSVVAASRQGEVAGYIDGDEELARLLEIANSEDLADAIDQADPELLEELELAVEDIEYMRVAELRATCHLCLPLHGKVMTMREWRERGLHPDDIHTQLNPNSPPPCYCELIPADDARDSIGEVRAELREPLAREKIEGLKHARKTQRSITQQSTDKAMAAVAEALDSKEGRKVLRLLGQSRK